MDGLLRAARQMLCVSPGTQQSAQLELLHPLVAFSPNTVAISPIIIHNLWLYQYAISNKTLQEVFNGESSFELQGLYIMPWGLRENKNW